MYVHTLALFGLILVVVGAVIQSSTSVVNSVFACGEEYRSFCMEGLYYLRRLYAVFTEYAQYSSRIQTR